ncbi:MAG TPA: zf-HC2 domain-containing protein [Gemmataceae bacterium]|jgi:anti-sigma factor RsiW
MTCPDVRPLLPAHVYGDLPPDEAAAVAGHVRDCPACRAESAALAEVRLALDATPTPPVRVDVPGLFHAAADRQARSARRWRRAAVAAAALAAGLVVVLGLRLHVTVGTGHITIAWGEPRELSREAPPSAVAPVPLAGGSRLNEDFDDRLRLQQELIHALAADVEDRDRRRAAETDAIRGRLDAVQRLAAQRWAEAERWMNALYVAQFKRPEEKTNP